MARFFFVVIVLMVAGCATYEIAEVDPSYNRVVFHNDSPYLIKEDGIFNRWIEPGETVSINTTCYGRFKGLMTAYRVFGKDVNTGAYIRTKYAQRWYWVSVDGKNTIYRNQSVDAWVRVTEYSFHPNPRKGFVSYITPSSGPCHMGPEMIIRGGFR